MKRNLRITFSILAGLACGFGAQISHSEAKSHQSQTSQETARKRTLQNPSFSRDISGVFSEKGSSQVTLAFDLVRKLTHGRECHQFASRLLEDQNHGKSDTLWSIVLARWSELDPQGMIDFVEAQPDVKLRSLAWEAWAATDSELLATRVPNLNPPISTAVLRGIASRNPDLAIELSFQTPKITSSIRNLLNSGKGFSIEAIKGRLPEATYDGMRNPMTKYVTEELTKKDPREALAFIKDRGRTWSDPVAKLFANLATEDPDQAVNLLAEQPSSRSKAISSVQVAKTWATRDPEASLAWARAHESAEIREASLVAIASVIGGEDPEQGLTLLEEVEWKTTGQFYAIGEIRGPEKIQDQIEEHDVAVTHHVGRALLQNLAHQDPEAARHYINTQAPENHREFLLTIFDQPESE